MGRLVVTPKVKTDELKSTYNEKWGDVYELFFAEEEGDDDVGFPCEEIAEDLLRYFGEIRRTHAFTHGVVYQLNVEGYKKTLFADNFWDAIWQSEHFVRDNSELIRSATGNQSTIGPIIAALYQIMDGMAFEGEEGGPLSFTDLAREVKTVLSDEDMHISIATIRNKRVQNAKVMNVVDKFRGLAVGDGMV